MSLYVCTYVHLRIIHIFHYNFMDMHLCTYVQCYICIYLLLYIFVLHSSLLFLNICSQLLNKLHGGRVAQRESRADGQFAVSLDTNCPLFE